MYQRSGDVGLGVPFNILSYSVLTHLIAKHCNLDVGEFVYFLGNAHIYEEHINSLKEQIIREPYIFPKINIKNIYENIDDYTIDDFEIIDYQCHKKIVMNMIV
jgi:thymidylate synthase